MQTWFLLPLATGLISGLSTSAFLHTLEFIVRFHQNHAYLILALPIAGLTIALLYRAFKQEKGTHTSQIIEEIHEPREILPVRFAPLVFLSTLLSHLAGASVGREGAAVQIAASPH